MSPKAQAAFDAIMGRVAITRMGRQALLAPIMDKLRTNWETPASSMLSRHGCFMGGLICHINEVLSLALGMSGSIIERATDADIEEFSDEDMRSAAVLDSISHDSIVTAAVVHDLNKICDGRGERHYVPNLLKGDVQSDKKPWKISESYDPHGSLILGSVSESNLRILLSHSAYPSGSVSLALAEQWSPGLRADLSDDEAQAIIFHEGMYSKGAKDGYMGKESPLAILIHAADMLASRMGS